MKSIFGIACLVENVYAHIKGDINDCYLPENVERNIHVFIEVQSVSVQTRCTVHIKLTNTKIARGK